MQTGAHRGKTSRPWFHRPTIALIIAAVRIVTGMALTQLIRHYVKPPTGVTPPQNWLASLTRWDANWYSNIARHGYFSLPSHAFYPGFPLLVRLLAPLAGYSGATVVLSWAATWIAIWGLLRVCDHYASAASSDAATLLFAWGPLSLFLVAGYPESLLVALTAWSLYFMTQQKWAAAAILGGVASGILAQGLIIGPCLALTILLSDPHARGWARALGWGLVSEAGFLGYCLYSQLRYANAFIMLRAERTVWRNQLSYPFHAFIRDAHYTFAPHVAASLRIYFAGDVLLGGICVAVILGGAWVCRRRPSLIPPTVMLTLGLVLSSSTSNGATTSLGRFVVFLAPLYVVLATLLLTIPVRVRMIASSQLITLATILGIIYGIMFAVGYRIV